MTPTVNTRTDKAGLTGTATEPCPFVWYELHTPDAATAAAFYKPVLRWTTKDAGVPNKKYTLVCVGEAPIGGLLEKPAAAFASGEKPAWIGYIGVPDVHLYAKRVQEAGGVLHRSAEEIPGVGTFAVAGDPQGAIFTLFQAEPATAPPEQPPASAPGMPAWNELGAIDWQPEFRFYADLFGWTKADAIEMGPMGVYQLFATGSQPVGGMMTMPDAPERAGWLFYFNVEDIDAAVGRVKQNGGTVLHGPAVVPGGQQIAQRLDAQGAIFGMVGPGKQKG